MRKHEPPKSDGPVACQLCEVEIHDTICERCSRLVCYQCCGNGEECDECRADDEATKEP